MKLKTYFFLHDCIGEKTLQNWKKIQSANWHKITVCVSASGNFASQLLHAP